MATPVCVLINGPRGIGKTTAAEVVAKRAGRRIVPVMGGVKEAALTDAGLSEEMVSLFEMMKDTPIADLDGRTPRQCYIEYANRERQKKATVFAERWTAIADHHALFHDAVAIIVPDVRFIEEFYAALKIFKPQHIFLLRIKRVGADNKPEDGQWEGDVGSYFDTSAVVWGHRELTMTNDLDLDFFKLEASVFIEGFIARASKK